jgi:outer membrane receptor protein involved in Fe transport
MASTLLMPLAAYAQEPADGPPAEAETPTLLDESVRALEEIIVTARQREEKLQDVPISITAFSAKGMRDRNIQDAYDLANFTPNFQLTTNLGRRLDNPIFRGQFGPLIGSTPNASFFIDGVFVSGSIGSTNVANLERIEVLRGPQSAQFGRATFAGAVNYITRKPTDEYEGAINAEYGEHGRLDLGAWASGPIIKDKLYFFAGASKNKWDGEWRNNLQPYDVVSGYSYEGYNIPGRPDISNIPYGQEASFGGFAWDGNTQRAGDPPCLSGGPLPPFVNGEASAAGCAPTIGDNTELGGTDTETYTLKLTWDATDNLQFNAKYEQSEADDDHIVYNFIAPGSDNHCYNRSGGGHNDLAAPFLPVAPGTPLDTKHITGADPRDGGTPGATGTRTPGALCGAINDNGYTPKLNLPNLRRGVRVGVVGRTGDDGPQIPHSPPLGYASTGPAPFLGQEETVKRFYVDSIADIGDYELTGRYAHNERDSEYVRDLERNYGLGPLTTGLFEANTWDDAEDDSAEIRLASPGDSRLRWQIGGYWYNFEMEQHQRNFTGFGDAYIRSGTGSEEVTNTAVFGSIELDLFQDWTLAFEGRYAKDEVTRTSSAFEVGLDPSLPCGVADRTGDTPTDTHKLDCEANFYSWTPRATLTWNIKDDGSMTGYAQIAEGNKPGGYNFAYFDGDVPWDAVNFEEDVVIEEEEATTYELGLKGTYLDGALTANVAVFYIDWENQAINARECLPQNPPASCQDNNIVRNAGESEVKGMELEMNWYPTDRQSYTLGYGYTDSELTEYVDKEFATLQCPAGCFDFSGPDGKLTEDARDLINELGDVSGNKAPRTPKHNMSASQTYQAPLYMDYGDLEWFVRNDVIYESKKYTSPANLSYAPEQWTWNGRIGLESYRWTATFYVDNITGEKSPQQIQSFPLFDYSQGYNGTRLPSPLGEPVQQDSYLLLPRRERNVGVMLTVRFGA